MRYNIWHVRPHTWTFISDLNYNFLFFHSIGLWCACLALYASDCSCFRYVFTRRQLLPLSYSLFVTLLIRKMSQTYWIDSLYWIWLLRYSITLELNRVVHATRRSGYVHSFWALHSFLELDACSSSLVFPVWHCQWIGMLKRSSCLYPCIRSISTHQVLTLSETLQVQILHWPIFA